MSAPALIFGCANIGYSFTQVSEVRNLLDTVKSAGIRRLDTAARYPTTAPGLSQKLLGNTDAAEKCFAIDTKIEVAGKWEGSLTAAAIQESLNESSESLHVSQIEVLYCHAPDNETPLEEQAAAFDFHFREGRFKQLGVSNFSVSMLEKWMEISTAKGYLKPSVYQGQYNLFCRGLETRLFPTLRKYDISFVAFRRFPHREAGKLNQSTASEDLKSTRFDISDGNPLGQAFRHWYDKDSMHRGISKFKKLCDSHNISMEAASFRWIVFNPALKAGDGIVLGASKISQIYSNIAAIKNGP